MSDSQPADDQHSSRARRLRSRPRLMDGGVTPQEFGPGTPVAIYKRVSSDEQVEGFSLSAQERLSRVRRAPPVGGGQGLRGSRRVGQE